MHHCACAAILASGGIGKHRDAPRSHEHVIEHFGLLVATEPGFLGESGRLLSRARTDRNVADYELGNVVDVDAAAGMTEDARRFVEACAKRWRLRES